MGGMQVPMYRSRRELAALPTVRRRDSAEPLARGIEAIAEGGERLAAGINAVVEKERREQDAAVLDKAYADLVNAKTKIVTEYSSQQGTNALAARAGVDESWKVAVEGVAKSLNDRQRPRFERLALHEGTALTDAATRHAAQQGEIVKDESYKAAVGASLSDVARSAVLGHIDAASAAMAMGRARVEAQAKRNGLPTAGATRDYDTAAHMSVIEALLQAQRPETAKEYLDTYRGEIDGVKLETSGIEKQINAADLKERARDGFDTIWKETKGDIAAATARIRAHPDRRLGRAMLDEERERVTDDGALTNAADKDPEAKLGIKLLGNAWHNVKGDPLFDRISPGAQERVLDRQRVLKRTRKDASASDRAAQHLANKTALEYLGWVAEDEQRLAALNPDQDEMLAQAEDWVKLRAEKYKAHLWKNDAQAFGAYKAKVEEWILKLPDKKKQPAVRKNLIDHYVDHVEASGGKKPQPRDMAPWFAESLTEVGEKPEDYVLFQNKMPGFLAEQKGITHYVPLKSEANEKILEDAYRAFGLEAPSGAQRPPPATSPAKPPAPSGTMKIRKIGGTQVFEGPRGLVPDGYEEVQ